LTSRALHAAFQIAKRVAEATSAFARVPGYEGGRYIYTGTGDVNTYALFAELFLNLTRESGRAGVIVPTGIATDATTAPFFAHLVSTQRLGAIFSFENEEMIFPGIHHAMKFCLLVLKEASSTAAEFIFFARQVAHLEDERRRFTLSPGEIARINPNTKTAPVFRAREDARLTAAIYDRVPVLIDESKGAAGNPWRANFHSRIWHMAEDSAWFRTASQLSAGGWLRSGTDWVRPGLAEPRALTGGHEARHLDLSTGSNALAEERFVPLYEAKMIHQFDHRWATYIDDGSGETSRDVTLAKKQDARFEPAPRYWVPEREVADRLHARGWARGWLMGWRDITNATNERTVITTVFPRSAVGHTSPLFMLDQSTPLVAALGANLSALAFDFVARQKLGGTHLTYGYLNQFPILPPTAYTEADLAFIVTRVTELSYTSNAMAPFARDLGYDGAPFAWDEDRRAGLRAELDAWYALAYGLTREELCYVLDPKNVMGADYPSETFRVLQKNECARYGEYRTQRLVLAAYDALAAAAPDTAAITDGHWDGAINDEIDVRLLLAAIVKRMREPRPLREVNFAYVYAAQPHLLMPHLTAAAAAEWQRLVGDAAALPVLTNVPSFSSSRLVHFAPAQAQLAARRAWRYDAKTGTVDRGAAIYDIPLPPWAEGRADFVWHALRSINLTAATVRLSQPEQIFVAQAAAA